jgi:hypothetical protein
MLKTSVLSFVKISEGTVNPAKPSEKIVCRLALYFSTTASMSLTASIGEFLFI